MDRKSNAAVVILILLFCTSCGQENNAGSNQTYGYVTPNVNSQQIYTVTTLDNSNNTINQTMRKTVTAVNADGSYIYVQDDPTDSSITVNGTIYSIPTETITENGSGEVLLYSYTTNSAPVTCSIAPHGAGPDYPLTIGQTWMLNYSITCGSATPILYTQTGSVVDIESVTVPAGTFSVIKLLSTLTWTGPLGTTRTESITTWRDVNTSIVVKRMINIEYSGTPLVNGYPMTTTTALKSQS